jgi:hypothetical protein
MYEPFAVKDCTLLAIATGIKAQNLLELRNRLETISTDCIYYHFWGGLLHSKFDNPEYQNDFASWAQSGLHDGGLAERLGIIDPTDYDDLEALRHELLEVIDERLDETEMVPWAKAGQHFHFIHSQIVVVDTRKRIGQPEELTALVPHLSTSSIFYHFIDARRRAPRAVDDFSLWLESADGKYRKIIRGLKDIDPYFSSLAELRAQIAEVFAACLPRKRGS